MAILLSRICQKIQIPDQRNLRHIGKIHMRKFYLSPGLFQHHRLRIFRQNRLFIQKIKDPPRRSQRILQFCHHPRNLIKRFRILVGITRKLVSCPTVMPPEIAVKSSQNPHACIHQIINKAGRRICDR